MEALILFASELSAKYPAIVGIMAVLYSISIGFKVLFSALKTYVLESPSKSDDVMVAELEENKIFKAVKYVMDLFLRIKVK